MSRPPADWAIEKACRLRFEHETGDEFTEMRDAFARYIEAHEEPPVDPLLIEAREICASMPGLVALQADAYRRGSFDAGPMVVSARIALRRGMELASPATPGLPSTPSGAGVAQGRGDAE